MLCLWLGRVSRVGSFLLRRRAQSLRRSESIHVVYSAAPGYGYFRGGDRSKVTSTTRFMSPNRMSGVGDSWRCLRICWMVWIRSVDLAGRYALVSVNFVPSCETYR